MTTTWDLRGDNGEPQPVPPHTTFPSAGPAPEHVASVAVSSHADTVAAPTLPAAVIDLSDGAPAAGGPSPSSVPG